MKVPGQPPQRLWFEVGDAYLRDYLWGVEMRLASWGWDLEAQALLPNPGLDQHWQDWPVRLYKAVDSVQSFGFDAPFTSLKKYALLRIGRGVSFCYNGRDLAGFFTEGRDPYKTL